jgi:hypothetical protein
MLNVTFTAYCILMGKSFNPNTDADGAADYGDSLITNSNTGGEQINDGR